MSLVLNAVAACPVFSRHSVKQHYLQPPEQLGFKLSQHLLEIASLQLWCRGKQQRVQMLCCSRPLSVLALRLACAANTHQGHRSMEQRVAALIMKRCLSHVGRHESDRLKEKERINALLRDAFKDPKMRRLMQHPDVLAIRASDAEAASLLDQIQSQGIGAAMAHIGSPAFNRLLQVTHPPPAHCAALLTLRQVLMRIMPPPAASRAPPPGFI